MFSTGGACWAQLMVFKASGVCSQHLSQHCRGDDSADYKHGIFTTMVIGEADEEGTMETRREERGGCEEVVVGNVCEDQFAEFNEHESFVGGKP